MARARTPSGHAKWTPFVERGGAVQFEIISAVEMALQIEVVVDGGVEGGEFLQASNPPETEHGTLPSSEWKMGVFRSVVSPPTGPLKIGAAEFTQRRAIGSEPISHDRFRPAVALHGFPEELHSRPSVPPLRDEGLQDFAF
jgi:hypothetical protein